MKNNLIIKIFVYPILIILGLLLLLVLGIVLYMARVELKAVHFDNEFTYYLHKYPFRYSGRYRVILCYNMYGCGWKDAYPVIYTTKIYDINAYKDKLYISIPVGTKVENKVTRYVKKIDGENDVYNDTYKKIIIEYK